jgi:membrane protein
MSSPPPESFAVAAIAFLRVLAQRFRRLRLPQTAASLAFLSLLALVPVFTIAVSLLGALPVLSQPRAVLLDFLAANLFLPSFSAALVRHLDQFAAKVNELSLLGAMAFLATAFTALLTIDRTLNRIWPQSRPRPLARRLTVYWTFLTLGPLMLGVSAAVHGVVVSELLGGVRSGPVRHVWLSVLPWGVAIVGLTLLYRIVPNAPVRWREALAGAVLAAAGLEVLKQLLAFQVAKLPTYTVVYGAFAALPLFLIWLFALWLTVLAGALVAACLPEWRRTPAQASAEGAAAVFARCVGVLRALAVAAAQGRPTIAPEEAFAPGEADTDRAEDTARLLVELGYLERYWRLGETAHAQGEPGLWEERWALRGGAASLTLRPLFEHVWNAPAPPQPAAFDLDRIGRRVAELAGDAAP